MRDANSIATLTDISMHKTTPTALACCLLLRGPALFVKQNMFKRTTAVGSNDHYRLQMSIGTRTSCIGPRVEPYGADAYSYLVEGEKVWYISPPTNAAIFHTLFEKNSSAHPPRSELEYQRLGVHVVKQNEGDAIYIPGGWISLSQSVGATGTVAFGSSYLRPWKLATTIEDARTRKQSDVEYDINIRGIFKTASRGRCGIESGKLKELMTKWAAVVNQWNYYDSMLASATDEDIDNDDDTEDEGE